MVYVKSMVKKLILPPRDETKDKTLNVVTSEQETVISACRRAGISIDDYVQAIKAALVADKTSLDKWGAEHVEADHTTRLRAALMGLELEGYTKAKALTTDASQNQYNTVIYQWKKTIS